MIICPMCRQRIKCPSCDGYICSHCGEDLSEDLPFTEESEIMPANTVPLDDVIERALNNPEFKAAYDGSEDEYQQERKRIQEHSIEVEIGAGVSPEHQALLDSGAEQSPEDIELAVRMGPIQAQTLTSTWYGENETLT